VIVRDAHKRPFSIRSISAAYVLSPVLMPLQVVLYHYDATHQTLLQLVGIPSWNSLVVMAMSVAVGVGVWQVRWWGWYAFLVHAAAVMANNVWIAQHTAIYPLEWMLVSNAFLLALAGFFIWSNVREPFFNPEIRHWEQKPRVGVKRPAVLKSQGTDVAGETVDISESGAFIACDPEKLEIGNDEYPLVLSFPEQDIACRAEIVWRSPGHGRLPPGVGVRFHDLSRADRKVIRAIVKEIHARHIAAVKPGAAS
jgi:hypothetical protein